MRLESIAKHLRPYRMLASRRTTINHMFAAAVAPHDQYDEERVREAMALLGNDPDGDLACAYRGAAAEAWDHVFATMKDSQHHCNDRIKQAAAAPPVEMILHRREW